MIEVLFIVDPLPSLNLKKDSSIAMICAAARHGWSVSVTEPKYLYCSDGKAHLNCSKITIHEEVLSAFDSSKKFNSPWYQLSEWTLRPLNSFPVIFMRKEPPFDIQYIYTTYILDLAESDGSLVVNKPSSLRDCNEKFYVAEFPEFTPPTLVSQNLMHLRAFHQKHQDVVFKPLDGMGGKGIFRINKNDSNLNVVLETLTAHEQTPIMAQKYIPEITEGDKRIILIDGKAIPFALARIPQLGEFRANLATGAKGVTQPLSARDQEICTAIGKDFQKRGLLFVGIDIIGDYLTEINVTCPTGIREIDTHCNTDIGLSLIKAAERHL